MSRRPPPDEVSKQNSINKQHALFLLPFMKQQPATVAGDGHQPPLPSDMTSLIFSWGSLFYQFTGVRDEMKLLSRDVSGVNEAVFGVVRVAFVIV